MSLEDIWAKKRFQSDMSKRQTRSTPRTDYSFSMSRSRLSLAKQELLGKLGGGNDRYNLKMDPQSRVFQS